MMETLTMIDDSRFAKSYKDRAEDKDGVTLVAFYGDRKPDALLQVIHSINGHFLTGLGDVPGLYRPYSDTQIHGTLCGMEGTRRLDGQIVLDNMNQRSDTGPESGTFDIEEVLDFFASASWPLVIQLGGYQEVDSNPYDRVRRPWIRSFELRGDGLAVLMGWTIAGKSQLFAPLLLGLRKYFEAFGLVHKYHIDPRGQDNDLFLVIGSLGYEAWKSKSEQEKAEITVRLLDLQRSVRTSMAGRRVRIPLAREDISVVKYKQTTLETVEYAKNITEITADEVRSLYAQR